MRQTQSIKSERSLFFYRVPTICFVMYSRSFTRFSSMVAEQGTSLISYYYHYQFITPYDMVET